MAMEKAKLKRLFFSLKTPYLMLKVCCKWERGTNSIINSKLPLLVIHYFKRKTKNVKQDLGLRYSKIYERFGHEGF